MNQYLRLIVLVGSLLGAPAPAFSGVAVSLQTNARKWCASCHIIEMDQNRASDIAPTFGQIANYPMRSKLSIAAWLTDPHPPMPKLSLSKDEIDNLVAYIETMKVK